MRALFAWWLALFADAWRNRQSMMEAADAFFYDKNGAAAYIDPPSTYNKTR